MLDALKNQCHGVWRMQHDKSWRCIWRSPTAQIDEMEGTVELFGSICQARLEPGSELTAKMGEWMLMAVIDDDGVLIGVRDQVGNPVTIRTAMSVIESLSQDGSSPDHDSIRSSVSSRSNKPMRSIDLRAELDGADLTSSIASSNTESRSISNESDQMLSGQLDPPRPKEINELDPRSTLTGRFYLPEVEDSEGSSVQGASRVMATPPTRLAEITSKISFESSESSESSGSAEITLEASPDVTSEDITVSPTPEELAEVDEFFSEELARLEEQSDSFTFDITFQDDGSEAAWDVAPDPGASARSSRLAPCTWGDVCAHLLLLTECAAEFVGRRVAINYWRHVVAQYPELNDSIRIDSVHGHVGAQNARAELDAEALACMTRAQEDWMDRCSLVAPEIHERVERLGAPRWSQDPPVDEEPRPNP